MKKLITVIICFFFLHIAKAQNEFITVWKPGTSQQIQFPGRGTNFNVAWEEVGYPQHNGNLSNVNSTLEFTVNFGSPLNPVPANTTYKIKISDGNGSFNQVRFFDSTGTLSYLNSDHEKLLEIAQWGNIQWQTFDNAFVWCSNMNVTATDAPVLTNVTQMNEMFFFCFSLVGNPSFNTWDTSTVTNMYYMFGDDSLFNAPINEWNVSNVTNMSYMFDVATNFNQPLSKWNTANVITMQHMFHSASSFNQDLSSWNTGNVTNMNEMFHAATAFNQNIGAWNLSSLVNGVDMLKFSGLNCQNYDNALFGWNNNPQTPNNIDLGSALPLNYKHQSAINARTNLINYKNWLITGDSYNSACTSILGTDETDIKSSLSIYPNPATHSIFIKSKEKIKSAEIIDASGRVISGVLNPDGVINIKQLPKGNYFLKIETSNNKKTVKFIKN
ncbi:BspA family leucine-rich repeat surface protein [Chryseobacterium sp.]|uniref:BspA family leucine-rich repeat surface protein n=1 Tax=Chryseobacterium sp. TaxID=1871047 RepID=UPI0011C85674|nr:BspA family leucine-rich repeat surface protein [Chryseobacterium sp.]TXF79115.1 BspA family leucine-rich repeat surface protein [Chryseobacterium sp.]